MSPLHGLVACAVLAAALALAATTGRAIAAETASVDIAQFLYSPPTITVRVSDTVTWTNRDVSLHSATATSGAPQPFDTGLLGKDESASVTFTAPGQYDYFCSLHSYMTGTVVVEQAGSGVVPNSALTQPIGTGGAGGYRAIGVLFVLTLLAAGVAVARRRGSAG